MRWRFLLGLLAAVILITWYEWPKIKGNKEKAAFAVLTAIGCLLAVLLVFYPYMPNPDQIVETLYRPLGKLLEK